MIHPTELWVEMRVRQMALTRELTRDAHRRLARPGVRLVLGKFLITCGQWFWAHRTLGELRVGRHGTLAPRRVGRGRQHWWIRVPRKSAAE
jgi:hypothetical protein